MVSIKYSYPITESRRLLYFYEKLALINASGYSIADLIKKMGIEEVCLYGYGMIGELIDVYLKGSEIITYVYDKKINKNDENKISRYIGFEELVKSDLKILISPINNVKEITELLMDKGVSRKRIVSLHFIVDQIYDQIINLKLPQWNNGDKIFVITGASFKNKGAQSMLFVTMDELYKKFPGCHIYFSPENSISDYMESDINRYKFRVIRGGCEEHSDLYDILPLTTAIVDISGYSVTSEGYNRQIRNTLATARSYDIPLYMMPQSFGPFDFSKTDRELFKRGLAHAKVIYAREEKSLNLLKEEYQLTNVKLSRDIVFQNKGINYSNVYRNDYTRQTVKIESDNNVAIIPNVRNYEFGDKKEILKCYSEVVERLLECGKTIYIIPHSNDIEACKDIYKMYEYNIKVRYIDSLKDCIEFEELIKNFEFVIGSRYHAIVHSIKEGIPCIAIGWEEKYEEIMRLVGQESYCFNVRKGLDKERVIEVLDLMLNNYKKEKDIIINNMEKYQDNSCFNGIGE